MENRFYFLSRTTGRVGRQRWTSGDIKGRENAGSYDNYDRGVEVEETSRRAAGREMKSGRGGDRL